MTSTIYIHAHEPTEGRRLIDELLEQGFERRQLHVYGKDLPGGLPVEATRWRNTFMAILPGALVGAVALPSLSAIFFRRPSEGLVLLLGLIGAAVVGTWSLLHERRKASPMNAQQSAMRHGEMMIAASVDADRVSEIEQRIARDHPDMSMLGPDAGGSTRGG